MSRWIFAVLVCVGLLTACSKAELIYDNADWLAYRWVDKLLDAEGGQPARWRALFADVLEQHRHELLPDVVALLHGLAVQTDHGLTRDGLNCLWQSAERVIRAHGVLFVSPGVEVLGDVSANQVGHLGIAFDERIAEYRETYLQEDHAARQTARVDRFLERIEYWTGELTTQQARVVGEAVRRMPDLATGWLAYRAQQQQRLLQLLRETRDRQALAAFLRAWWVERADRDPLLVQHFELTRVATIDLLVDLHAGLDATQRRDLTGKIASLRDDLSDAVGDPERVGVVAREQPLCAQTL